MKISVEIFAGYFDICAHNAADDVQVFGETIPMACFILKGIKYNMLPFRQLFYFIWFCLLY